MMRRCDGFWKVAVLALICCMMQQVRVVAAAQEERPRVAIGNTGCSATTKPGEAGGASSPALTGERRPLYRLRTSDVVEISFDFAPEFNQVTTLQPDGLLPLKDLDAVYAEGLTLPQLRDCIRNSYAEILREPGVTLVLKDFEKPYFVATGQLVHPGKYELRGDTTITEAIGMAGGFNGQARHSQVVLFRRVSNELVESRVVNVKEMLQRRDLNEDIHLKPGDMLFVPQNAVSKIRQYLPASNLGLYWNQAHF